MKYLSFDKGVVIQTGVAVHAFNPSTSTKTFVSNEASLVYRMNYKTEKPCLKHPKRSGHPNIERIPTSS